jgi:hypothetical protein
MRKDEFTIKLTAFKGEINGKDWIDTLQEKASESEFAENSYKVHVDNFETFVEDYLDVTIKKGVCTYTEIKYGSITKAVVATNSDKDYAITYITF